MRDAIINFREKYTAILGSSHSLNVRFVYVSKSIYSPHPKVIARADGCKALVKQNFSAAGVSFDFWGCAELLAQIRAVPQTQMTMDISKYFTTGEKSVVCLVKLKSYAHFLTDDHGLIRKSVWDQNVRDYQGKRNPVNSDIRESLGNRDDWELMAIK